MHNEIRYRKLQRQAGEVLVAIRLTIDLLKGENEDHKGLQAAVDGLIGFKSNLFRKIHAMEDQAGMDWGK